MGVGADFWAVPQLKDELERKSIETLDWIVQQSLAGQMADSEVKVALQTVFSLVSGLVSNDITAAIGSVRADTLAKTLVRKVFHRPGDPRLFVVRWEVGSSEVVVTRIDRATGAIARKPIKRGDSREAREALDSLVKQMTQVQGLEELK